MKRALLTLSFCCALPVLAQVPGFGPSDLAKLTPVVTSAACATTDTTADHDEFLEGFETPTTFINDGNAWTWSGVGTTANINRGATAPSGGPAGTCERTWHLTVPTDGTATYDIADKGSLIDIDASGLVVTIPFYIVAGPDTTGEQYMIFRGINQVSSAVFNLQLRNLTGSIQVLAEGNSTPTWTTITTGAWHTMVVTLDAAAAALGSSYAVDGGAAVNFTRVAARDLQKFHYGPSSGLAAGEDGEYYIGTVAANTP